MPDAETPQLLTAEELAERLKVTPALVRSWASRGVIPAVRITGRTRRYALADVMKALGARTVGPNK